MEIPRHVIFGPNAVEKIPDILKAISSSRRKNKILVLSGTTITNHIVEEKILPVLDNSRIAVVRYMISEKPITYKTILNILSVIRENKINLVLGVGGGRIIDAGKLSASLSSINFISIPTNPSNDGIASPAVSYLLRQEMKKAKRKYSLHAPIAVIADTKIISQAPPIAIASGCGDMLAKFVAIRDWQLAYRLKGEDYSEYAASMALMSAKLVLEKVSIIKQGFEEGIRVLVKALIGSGVSMSIAGSSRPASGSEHLFSHALDLLSQKYGFKPAYHGLQTGLGAIMMMWLHGGDWEKIRDALKIVGAATNAYELGIEPKYIIEALTLAHKIRPERYTILGHRGLTRSAAERMAKETGVI